MDTIVLLTWATGYISLATIIFNLLRYGMKSNLLSTIILSASLPFLIFRIRISDDMQGFFVENIYAIILLGSTTALLMAGIGQRNKVCDSEDNTNTQQGVIVKDNE